MPTLSAQCVTAAQSCRAAVSRTSNEILERILPEAQRVGKDGLTQVFKDCSHPL